jgi:aspartate/methionine/tyrosine aminotransferase
VSALVRRGRRGVDTLAGVRRHDETFRVMYSARSAIDDVPSPLALALEALSATRLDAIDLTVSNPTRVGLSYAAYDPSHAEPGAPRPDPAAAPPPAYAPDPLGLREARQTIARHWPGSGARPEPEHVLLLPSSSEAYHYVFTLLCDPGDEVLAPEPSYPLLAHLARYAGVVLVPYRLEYDGAWHIDLDSVRRARSSRTRAIILISPNNPTGSYTSDAEFEALAQLDLPLVSDEVFARYDLEPGRGQRPSALGATRALTFCIDGLSKSAGLPQLKLSWMAVSGPALEVEESMRRLSWIADTFLSVATPIQLALPHLLERSEAFRAPFRERLVQNLACLRAALAGSAASALACQGGWYAVVRLPDVASEEEWVLGLADSARVLTHPGYFYDFHDGAPYLVLSLIPAPDEFARGAQAIRREVDARTGGARR